MEIVDRIFVFFRGGRYSCKCLVLVWYAVFGLFILKVGSWLIFLFRVLNGWAFRFGELREILVFILCWIGGFFIFIGELLGWLLSRIRVFFCRFRFFSNFNICDLDF